MIIRTKRPFPAVRHRIIFGEEPVPKTDRFRINSRLTSPTFGKNATVGDRSCHDEALIRDQTLRCDVAGLSFCTSLSTVGSLVRDRSGGDHDINPRLLPRGNLGYYRPAAPQTSASAVT